MSLPNHPWITFRLDLARLSPPTWVTLGECVSKIQHLVETPLMPRVGEAMRQAFVSKGIHGTAAIEGNTLALEEVKQRLQHELELPESQEYLGIEIDNLDRGYAFLSEVIAKEELPQLSEGRVKEYNRIILSGLELDDDVVPGEYALRQHGVMHYRAPSPAEIRASMPELVDWLNDGTRWQTPDGMPDLAITVLKAITAHLYLAWIHPFGDGNGRTARMVEAEVLARGGIPVVAFHLLSDHYNRTRTAYYRRLAETSRVPQGYPEAFIDYAVQGLADGLRQQIDQVKAQHREVVWRDFVHDQFRGEDSLRYQRLRRLAMDLALAPKPVPKAALWDVSERVRASYRDKTLKTVTRDVNELTRRGLLLRGPGGYKANLQILDAFVPPRREPHSARETA